MPHSLVVKTPDSQSGKPGSTPRASAGSGLCIGFVLRLGGLGRHQADKAGFKAKLDIYTRCSEELLCSRWKSTVFGGLKWQLPWAFINNHIFKTKYGSINVSSLTALYLHFSVTSHNLAYAVSRVNKTKRCKIYVDLAGKNQQQFCTHHIFNLSTTKKVPDVRCVLTINNNACKIEVFLTNDLIHISTNTMEQSSNIIANNKIHCSVVLVHKISERCILSVCFIMGECFVILRQFNTVPGCGRNITVSCWRSYQDQGLEWKMGTQEY